MGYIKEPDGVDFIIKSKPLTDKQKLALSEFIKADKAKQKLPNTRKSGTKSIRKAKRPA